MWDMQIMITRKVGFINIGFEFACEKGDKCIVEYFIEKGASNLNFGMLYAATAHREDRPI